MLANLFLMSSTLNFLYLHSMVNKYFILLLVVVPLLGHSQLTDTKQKAINNYIQLANHLTNELQSLGPSFVRYYQFLDEYKKGTRMPSSYVCKLSEEPYYYQEAIQSSSALGSSGSVLLSKIEVLRKDYQKIDATCKAIEIYFRLNDYQSDKFQKFEELVMEASNLVAQYNLHLQEVHIESERLFALLQPYQATQPYHKADKVMRTQLAFERELIDSWIFNSAEEIHTGWAFEKAQKHVLDDEKKIDLLLKTSAGLQYPASSMVSSFVESIQSLQQTKKSGVDGYTYESQQSDKHSNDLYLNLINYYNNAAVSFYNNYINMAWQNGYRGIYSLNYVQQFSVRKEAKTIKIDVTPFSDKPITEMKVTATAAPVPAAAFKCLSSYVDFINEGVRQLDNMMNSMRSVNGDASRGKAMLITEKRVLINYHYKNFELPITLFQQTVDQTKALPLGYQKSLTEQANVLYSILNEINQWNNVLLADAAAKQLAKDSLNHVYSVVNRYKTLVDTFDERKEKLYNDVRKIFESYKPLNPKSSWNVSGGGLRLLLDEDYKELVKAKKYLTGDSTAKKSDEPINKMVRDLITNEYQNLSGIQKLGRYNGNCPYSPYEDLPKYSKTFLEIIERESVNPSPYRHPYNEVVHVYNQSLVEQYNKFASLSNVPLLQAVKQLEIFEVMPPEKPKPKKVETVAIPTEPEIYIPEETQQEPVKVEKTEKEANSKRQKKKKEPVVKSDQPVVMTGRVIHDTVRITDVIRIETVRQDTVYVSKTDTVYVGMSGEMTMSMEGYATNNMVLLLDVSGSMNTPDKLPLLKKSVLLLLKMMREEDEVSIITYSGKAKIELPPTSFKQEAKITKVIERLKPEGSTDGNAGIKLAFEVADKNYIRGGNNRIILATDGEFSISKEMFDLVKRFSEEDIFVTVFNFGKTTLSAKNLKQLAALGKGNYEYITRENVDVKLITEAKAKKKK